MQAMFLWIVLTLLSLAMGYGAFTMLQYLISGKKPYKLLYRAYMLILDNGKISKHRVTIRAESKTQAKRLCKQIGLKLEEEK